MICYLRSSFYTDGILEMTKNIKGTAKLQAFQKNPVRGGAISVWMPVLNCTCFFQRYQYQQFHSYPQENPL